MDEKSAALRLLDGLENGTLGVEDAALLAAEIDPVYFYVGVRFLRACHPASDPVATAVLGRVVALTSKGASLVERFKQGEQDAISRWFEQNHDYRDYRGRSRDLVDTLAEKVEG